MTEKRKQDKKHSEKSDNRAAVRLRFVDHSGVQEPLKLQAFIGWIALPKAARLPKTNKELAKKIGVSQDTLTDWKRLTGFWKEVQQEQESYFRGQTADVLHALLEKAKTGRAAEVKLYLQYFDGFSEKHVVQEVEHPNEISEERKAEIARAMQNWRNMRLRKQFPSSRVANDTTSH